MPTVVGYCVPLSLSKATYGHEWQLYCCELALAFVFVFVFVLPLWIDVWKDVSVLDCYFSIRTIFVTKAKCGASWRALLDSFRICFEIILGFKPFIKWRRIRVDDSKRLVALGASNCGSDAHSRDLWNSHASALTDALISDHYGSSVMSQGAGEWSLPPSRDLDIGVSLGEKPKIMCNDNVYPR